MFSFNVKLQTTYLTNNYQLSIQSSVFWTFTDRGGSLLFTVFLRNIKIRVASLTHWIIAAQIRTTTCIQAKSLKNHTFLNPNFTPSMQDWHISRSVVLQSIFIVFCIVLATNLGVPYIRSSFYKEVSILLISQFVKKM